MLVVEVALVGQEHRVLEVQAVAVLEFTLQQPILEQ
jgi:hypothetical protein